MNADRLIIKPLLYEKGTCRFHRYGGVTWKGGKAVERVIQPWKAQRIDDLR